MRFLALLAFGFAFLVLALTGCGTTRDEQTKTVERVTTTTGPIIVETPVGNISIPPVRHEMVRAVTEVSTQQTRIDAPEVGQIMTAAANATPWGGILGAVVGLGGAAGALHQMAGRRTLARRFEEVVDGVERGMADLPDEHRARVIAGLEAEQSADTKRAVKARVG